MVKDLALGHKTAPFVPPDETTKYLTALLDGKVKKNAKKADKLPSQSHGIAARRNALDISTKDERKPTPSTTSSSLPAPKVSGLGVYTLSGLPGAVKRKTSDVIKTQQHAQREKQQKHLAQQHRKLLPPSRSGSQRPNQASRTPTLLNAGVQNKPDPARVSLEISNNIAPSAAIASSMPIFGLQLKPTKRPRYSQERAQGSSPLDRPSEEPLSGGPSSHPSLPIESGSTHIKLADPSLTTTELLETGSKDTPDLKRVINVNNPLSRLPASASAATEKHATTNPDSVAFQQFSVTSSVRDEVPRPDSAAIRGGSSKPGKGNFIRLNLKNKAGACRGARPKKQPWIKPNKHDTDTIASQSNIQQSGPKEALGVCSLSGIDPVDDFLDGAYQVNSSSTNVRAKATAARRSAIPNCSGHQHPCKLLTVKKNTENKGRQFFCCSLPRGEQCNHFEWADDTVAAAQAALMKNKTASGFIARQVASYMAQVKQLTVPELVDLLQHHGLDGKGKKPQLLTRLAIWVRDEIAKGMTSTRDDQVLDDGKDDEVSEVDDEVSEAGDEVVDANTSSDDEETDSSDEELEITGCQQSVADRSTWLSSTKDSGVCSTPASVNLDCKLHNMLQDLFGHSEFREGQEWAIRRCLANKKTLLVAPTGFGKSLCYTMTAAMKKGVCIVVSPLLSLINDQLRLLPPGMAAVTLSGAMSRSRLAATLDDIARNRIRIVFVSPERLTSASFRRLFRLRWIPERRTQERIFPPVSLLCIDEAHCLSQWAHHFRPSYLRLRSVISMIQPESVLAITATAGSRVVDDICRTLDIERSSGDDDTCGCTKDDSVRIMNCDRDNIDVSSFILASQEERLAKVTVHMTSSKHAPNTSSQCIVRSFSQLIDLLGCKKQAQQKSDVNSSILSHGSVIIYVWRQRDAEAIAENIQAASEVRGGVTVYHGGMDAAARSKAQSKFMRGKVRICVATVAFGLGINKADVVGVVHMYLSASPEHYLQEIGRAGRDGRKAHAISLVLADEVMVRHSLAHSDLISRSQVRSFLMYLSDCAKECTATSPRIVSAHVCPSISDAVIRSGCKSETIETLVSLMEHRDESLLVVEGCYYDRAHVTHRRSLEKIAPREPVVRAMLQYATTASGQRKDADQSGGFSAGVAHDATIGAKFPEPFVCSVTQCANFLGSEAEPRHVFAALRRLKEIGDIDYVLDTEAGRGLHLKLLGAGMNRLTTADTALIDELEIELTNRLNGTVEASCRKVLELNDILCQVASEPDGGNVDGKSPKLCLFQRLVKDYFAVDERPVDTSQSMEQRLFDGPELQRFNSDTQSVFTFLLDMEDSLRSESHMSLSLRTCPDYAVLAVTKFLHGLQPSARHPPSVMYDHPLFGRFQGARFKLLYDTVEKLINN